MNRARLCRSNFSFLRALINGSLLLVMPYSKLFDHPVVWIIYIVRLFFQDISENVIPNFLLWGPVCLCQLHKSVGHELSIFVPKYFDIFYISNFRAAKFEFRHWLFSSLNFGLEETNFATVFATFRTILLLVVSSVVSFAYMFFFQHRRWGRKNSGPRLLWHVHSMRLVVEEKLFTIQTCFLFGTVVR